MPQCQNVSGPRPKRKGFDALYFVSGKHFDGTKLLAVVVEKCKQTQLNIKKIATES